MQFNKLSLDLIKGDITEIISQLLMFLPMVMDIFGQNWNFSSNLNLETVIKRIDLLKNGIFRKIVTILSGAPPL